MKISLDKHQLSRATVSFACRRVNIKDAQLMIRKPYRPTAGDVVLAIIEELGQHKRVERIDGRRAAIAPGDLVVLAYGNRYAPDQFEGVVPHNLGPCAMVAAGGIAATPIVQHRRMDEATRIRPLGVLADNTGKAINLADYAIEETAQVKPCPPLFVACGTSMNSGKTHTACSLVRGLAAMGHRVGAVKLTGTGAGGDLWRMADSGAHKVMDFTDAGVPSTYLEDATALSTIAERLLNSIADDCDVMVAEIADGVSHPETCWLLQSSVIRSRLTGVFFAAADALGASGGYAWLSQQHLPVLAISGSLTLSPLAMRELSALVPANIMTAEELSSPTQLQLMLPDIMKPPVVMPLPLHSGPSSPAVRLAPTADRQHLHERHA